MRRRDGRPFQNCTVDCVRVFMFAVQDRWSAPGEPPLESFTAITDEPPEEIAAAGHDRCVIPLTEANLDAWLNPAGRATSELSRLLDDRSRPYYEHELAA
jgi:putative SOS response-associated peptidase YedK